MDNDTNTIPFEVAQSAKELIGKTVSGNRGSMKIISREGTNYKAETPDGSIKDLPVMWVLQMVRLGKLTVK